MKAIIIGASSGIGRELAKVFSAKGWELGLTARRLYLLEELQRELSRPAIIHAMDVRQTADSVSLLKELLDRMKDVDLVILNAGINRRDGDAVLESELDTVQTNVVGFLALSRAALDYFTARERGQLAGISSVAGLRGSPVCPAYSGSKAFVSNYLQGLRGQFRNGNVTITDIRPGFVATEMIARRQDAFWVASARKAAEQIYDAIRAEKKVAYITRRWALISFIYGLIPDWLLRWHYRRRGI